MAALKYWLWMTTAPGLSNRTKLLLLEHFSSPEDVYYAQPDELCLVEGVTKQQAQVLADKSLTRAETVLADCAKDGQFIVTMDDAAYPGRLRDMYDPPVVLYGKGSMPLFDEEAAVAVVGTRKCTPYGTGAASQLGTSWRGRAVWWYPASPRASTALPIRGRCGPAALPPRCWAAVWM